MAAEAEVQFSHFLDEHGLGSFQMRLMVWSILIALIDGYDIGAIAFAAPHLIAEWHVAPKALGLVLSASNIGVLFGSQIFGWIGDTYGRKSALITANLLFGVFTFIAAYSTDLTQLSWLRLIGGFGIGGVIPNVVAINAESAPRHLRATLAIIAVGLVPLGGAFAGFASAALVPQHGWQVLFEIGGVVPIVIALAAILGLSESIKYMTMHDNQRRKPEALIAAIRPDFKVLPNAAASLPRHRHFVRRRCADRQLDRLCRIELDARASARDFLRRCAGARHPVRHQRGRRHDLPDLVARQRLRLAARHRPARRHRRPVPRRLFAGLPVEELYMWSAIPFAAGAVLCFAIHVFNNARLKAHPELAKAQQSPLPACGEKSGIHDLIGGSRVRGRCPDSQDGGQALSPVSRTVFARHPLSARGERTF